jgi:hypothetical protein
MPFNYFPTEKEFHEVLRFVTQEVEPGDQPSLIDLTGPELEYSPPIAPCNHRLIKCGKFYGGVCKQVGATNMDHNHVYQLCGFCEQEKTGCLPTGTSDEWVCNTCVVDQDAFNFCNVCNRFDECDDMLHCGKCQLVISSRADEEIKDDEEVSVDEDDDDAILPKTQDGYAKDGFVVSDEDEEESPSPEPVRFKRRIQGRASRSFNDAHWDLMTEKIDE